MDINAQSLRWVDFIKQQIADDNEAPVTITTGPDTIASAQLQHVGVGDYIHVIWSVIATKGVTPGITVFTIEALAGPNAWTLGVVSAGRVRVCGLNQGASDTFTFSGSIFVRAFTAAGPVVNIGLCGYSEGSDCSVATGAGQIRVQHLY